MASEAFRSATSPIGILGGTFDPVHNAHLAIAQRALEALAIARVIWMPTGSPPYRRPPVAEASHRVAMLKLAIGSDTRYALDERELAVGASAYTFDTITALRAELGAATPIVMLIGSDQYAKLDAWHRSQELFALCRFAVFARPAGDASPARSPRQGVVHVTMEPLPISASDIRARIGRGEDVSALLPAPVLQYIRRHRLYGHP